MSISIDFQLTDHGVKRVRQRLGLPTKAVLRHIKKIITTGQVIFENNEEKKYFKDDNFYVFVKDGDSLKFCTVMHSKENSFHFYRCGKKKKYSVKNNFTVSE